MKTHSFNTNQRIGEKDGWLGWGGGDGSGGGKHILKGKLKMVGRVGIKAKGTNKLNHLNLILFLKISLENMLLETKKNLQLYIIK